MARRRLIATLFGLAIVVVLAAIRVADPYPVQAARDIAFDYFERLAPRPEGNYPVRIVDIDEASLAAYGQWPWPRSLMADLATNLTQLGAAAVVFDVLFPEPDRLSPDRIVKTLGPKLEALTGTAPLKGLADYDSEFAKALTRAPSVLGFSVPQKAGPVPAESKAGFAFVGPNPTQAVPRMRGATTSLPILTNAAHGMGSISLEPGGTVSVVRRLPLLVSNGTKLFPSLAIEALRVALNAKTFVVFSNPGEQGDISSIRIGGFEVPTTPSGALWLYYRPTQPSLYVSAKDILGPDYEKTRRLIDGNIVLIGTSATGLLDIRGTPLGTDMPGVEIHAQALQQILSGAYLRRTDWVAGLELVSFIVIGLTIVFLILRLGPLACFIVGGNLAIIMVGASWLAFNKMGLLVDPSFSLLGSFTVYSAMIFFQFLITDADKRKIRGAFAHYVAPTLLSKIEKSGDELRLGGESRELSIMFSDVRNFTSLSEGMEPARLVGILNILFGALGEEITNQFGTIDKFIGDAIMAFWNAPVDIEKHAAHACAAALGMRRKLHELNEADAFGLKADGRTHDEIAIGIGISTGEALVGNMGLETRFDYSCVGDTVNVASRVEGACKTVGYDIVVVESTRAAASDLAYLGAGAISLKGKSVREPIHILVGDAKLAGQEQFQALEKLHNSAIAALAAGEKCSEAIGKCLSLAPAIDPRLTRFYELLESRAADFPEAPEETADRLAG